MHTVIYWICSLYIQYNQHFTQRGDGSECSALLLLTGLETGELNHNLFVGDYAVVFLILFHLLSSSLSLLLRVCVCVGVNILCNFNIYGGQCVLTIPNQSSFTRLHSTSSHILSGRLGFHVFSSVSGLIISDAA